MVLGVFVGLFLNFSVSDPFIKKIILIDNGIQFRRTACRCNWNHYGNRSYPGHD